jgi:phosphohistidine swiveling domain-containing protein
MKEPQYQVYIRNDWPLPFVEPWAFGPTNVAKPPFRWQMILVANLGDKYAWCYYKDDVLKIGRDIDRHLAKLKNLAKFKQHAKQAETENRKFETKVSKTDLSKLSVRELSNLLRQWYAAHNRFTARFMPIDATDETLEMDIKAAFLNGGINLSAHDLSILLTPDSLTYIQKEHKDFCRIAKRFWKNLDSPFAQKAIAKHAKKWWWTVMGWGQHRPLDEKTIKKNLSKIKSIKALLAALKKDERNRRATLKLKSRLIQKLPKDAIPLLSAFEVLAKMHDTRKEMQMRMMNGGFAITKELLKKSHIPLAYRNFISVEEYVKLADNIKPPLKELGDRTKAYWCQIFSNGKILMLSGQKAALRIKQSKIGKSENSQNSYIQGVCASPGTARGRARVELNAQILNRTIKPGEILVTSQTTPEFAPAIKKAAAIVTDEGGITSHAAIVSRELTKPCVIGAKFATEILKTGDLVEVDANHGIVRRVE